MFYLYGRRKVPEVSGSEVVRKCSITGRLSKKTIRRFFKTPNKMHFLLMLLLENSQLDIPLYLPNKNILHS